MYNESMSQNGFTKSRNRGERLPLGIVMPYAQAWIDRFQGGTDEGHVSPDEAERQYVRRADVIANHPEWGNPKGSLAVLLLAERAGVTPSALGKWLRITPNGTIGFFDADAILTALGETGLWQTDPALCAFRDMAEAEA